MNRSIRAHARMRKTPGCFASFRISSAVEKQNPDERPTTACATHQGCIILSRRIRKQKEKAEMILQADPLLFESLAHCFTGVYSTEAHKDWCSKMGRSRTLNWFQNSSVCLPKIVLGRALLASGLTPIRQKASMRQRTGRMHLHSSTFPKLPLLLWAQN